MNSSEQKKLQEIILSYICEVKEILGDDFEKAVVYGSFARGDYGAESDIDIAIFTGRRPQEFYRLINEISEVTFEYSVQNDIVLSPVFQNTEDYNRMLKVMPYYQSIQREGIC